MKDIIVTPVQIAANYKLPVKKVWWHCMEINISERYINFRAFLPEGCQSNCFGKATKSATLHYKHRKKVVFLLGSNLKAINF